ncbi:MAG: glycosyltransferase [Pseudomonadales bacterium]|nr:glycosyltransferase [Pseudomonadales bacterium]
MTNRIDISICTCMREALLRNCLDSVSEIEPLDGVELSVTVIDNDAAGSAKSVVDAIGDCFPFPILYFLEERRGIPCARNRALDEAYARDIDYLVFIDDDEWVEPCWLSALYAACLDNGGNVVVSGGVISELPKGVPSHISGLFNNNKKHQSGMQVDVCATNNVLIPTILTRKFGLRFDETNPLAGGTDTMFFKNASLKGVRIIKEPEALVRELIPESRLTLRWMVKRKYRAGITEAWRKRRSGYPKYRILISALFHVLLSVLKCIAFAILLRRLQFNKSWLKCCRYVGVLSGLIGLKVESYRVVDSAL